jgi:hypothetical protein
MQKKIRKHLHVFEVMLFSGTTVDVRHHPTSKIQHAGGQTGNTLIISSGPVINKAPSVNPMVSIAPDLSDSLLMFCAVIPRLKFCVTADKLEVQILNDVITILTALYVQWLFDSA